MRSCDSHQEARLQRICEEQIRKASQWQACLTFHARVTGNAVPGREVHGERRGAGGSQDAAFTRKDGGKEEGERTILRKPWEMAAVAGLGLQSEEENSAPTELVHYLSCNWIIDLSITSWAKQDSHSLEVALQRECIGSLLKRENREKENTHTSCLRSVETLKDGMNQQKLPRISSRLYTKHSES